MTKLSTYEVLRRCALQFRKYEAHHTERLKSPMSDYEKKGLEEKVATNREFAEMCEEALETFKGYKEEFINRGEYIRILLENMPDYKKGDCWSMPNGDCVGIGCMHNPDNDKAVRTLAEVQSTPIVTHQTANKTPERNWDYMAIRQSDEGNENALCGLGKTAELAEANLKELEEELYV